VGGCPGEPIRFVSEHTDAAIASVSHFTERTNDLSNGLIWPKNG